MDKKYEALEKLNNSSCLSPMVSHIMCKAGLTDEANNDTNIYDVDGFICWENLNEILPEYTRDHYDYFVECMLTLAPSLCTSQKYFSKISPETFDQKFKQWIQWTTLPKTIKRCFELLKDEQSTSHVLAILLMMPVLERSIGDVYLLKGQQCPSMLKDLLVTEELKELLGPVILKLLRIMIGPPISLNLRNVTWHGFPSPGELSPRYGYFMLQIIISLGKFLQEKHILPSSLPHREFVKFQQAYLLKDVFPDLSKGDHNTLMELIHQSSFVMSRMEPFWLTAIQCLQTKRFVDCIVLLLPQLEHGVRRLYSVCNKCPERLVTAENSVLFTTFDIMLSNKLQDNSENQLRYYISDTYISMLLDLLSYPDGPRLRDRISHGESDYNEHFQKQETDTAQWEILANHVVSLCLSFCMLFIPEQSDLHSVDMLREIQSVAESYKSVFHPLSLIIYRLKELSHSLSEWKYFKRPSQTEMDSCNDWLDDLDNEREFKSSDVYNAGSHVLEQYGNLVAKEHLWLLKPFTDITTLISSLCDIELTTLYRKSDKVDEYTQGQSNSNQTSTEDEVIGTIRKIITEVIDICQQIKESCNIKYDQWKARTLRSRQRDTYKRMLNMIPKLSCGLRIIVVIVVCYLHTLKKDLQHSPQSDIKFLKFILKYCENTKNYAHPDKNRWDEASKYTDSLFNKCLALKL